MSRRIVFVITTCLTLAVGLLLTVSGPSTAGTGNAARQTTASAWVAISAGGFHSCGIRPDHTLWCWGHNGYGQLGLGDSKKRTAPTQVGTDTDWAGLTAGASHTCATRTDHTLWCWGWNRAGQLGLGDLRNRKTPARVGTGTDWADITAAGFAHTCATRIDHTLWCWGDNDTGQLGLGDTTDRTTPTRVGTGTDWADVSANNGFHTCGTRTDHTLWCWGFNGQSQLGLGDTTGRTIPTQVGADTDWADLTAGHRHTCGTRTDLTLWCWGENIYGQLGLGDTTGRTSPTQVGTDSDWARVSAGARHTCGIRSDQTMWCWGDNRYGQLGLGDQTDRLVPARV